MQKIDRDDQLHKSKRLSFRRLLLRAGNTIHSTVESFHSWALFGLFLSALAVCFILLWVIQSNWNHQPAHPTEDSLPMDGSFSSEVTETTQQQTVTVAEVTETKPPPPVIQSKYEELFTQNPDLVGWLTLANTTIDYPVVQGADNDYYLHQDYYGEESKYGCIFLDYSNVIEPLNAPCNLVLYGHNMKNDSMFGELDKYKKESFFKENPTFSFGTIYQDYTWEVFSVFVTDVSFYYNDTTFPSETYYASFLESCAEISMYETNVIPMADDIILTLSTCSYEFDNARFVVQARLVQETTSEISPDDTADLPVP